MDAFKTLMARGNRNGVAKRPRDSDGFPPPAGTSVNWVVAQPIQDMLNQGKELGWENLGTIGNPDHLRKHGDHTPWSQGKKPGIVYAKDTVDPPWLQGVLLKLCRDPDYDTTWIDFFNINNKQFNFAGVEVAGSGDAHLHVSVRKGHELKHVTLFVDIDRAHRGKQVGDFLMALTTKEQKQLLKSVEDTRFMLGATAADLGHPFQKDRKDWSAKLDAILKAVSGDDTAKILSGIKAEHERTRQALLDKIDQLAPTVAAAVAAQLTSEATAKEFAAAVAEELKARLAPPVVPAPVVPEPPPVLPAPQ